LKRRIVISDLFYFPAFSIKTDLKESFNQNLKNLY